MLGVWQLVLIFAIILVLFGAGKIPQIMKDLGSGVKAFKKGFDGDEGEVDIDAEVKKHNQSRKQQAKKTNKRLLTTVKNGGKTAAKAMRGNKLKVDKALSRKVNKKKNGKSDKKLNGN